MANPLIECRAEIVGAVGTCDQVTPVDVYEFMLFGAQGLEFIA